MAVAVVALGAIAAAALGAPGDLDPSFSKDGKLELRFSGGEESANDVVALPDGRLVVSGTTTDIGEDYYPGIAVTRLLANGKPDTSFGGDGRVSFNFPDSTELGTGLAVQADGKIVLTGGSGFELARLNTDGSFDTSFSTDGLEVTDLPGVTSESAQDVVALSDGRLLVAGSSKTGEVRKWTIARYTAAGALDPSFSGDGVATTDFPADGSIIQLAVQADGKIVAGGNAGTRVALARYLPDGGVDPSFSTDGQLSSDAGFGVSGLMLDGSGRIVTANLAQGFFSISRFTPGGDADPSFAGDGVAEVSFGDVSFATDLVGLPEGGMTVVGTTRHTNGSAENDFAIAQLRDTGELDTSFAGDGMATTDFFCDTVDEAHAIARQPDGRLIAVGSCQYSFIRGQYTDGNFAIAAYESAAGPHDADADGVLDRNDRCPQAFGPRKGDGCAVVKRSFITVHGHNGKLVGELASIAVDCELKQKVTLIRLAGGRDQVVDTVKPAGAAFKFTIHKGETYKVRTPKHLERRAGICNQATSSLVKP